eukprot:6181682-Pleurochrysis_carterae.AAC.5
MHATGKAVLIDATAHGLQASPAHDMTSSTRSGSGRVPSVACSQHAANSAGSRRRRPPASAFGDPNSPAIFVHTNACRGPQSLPNQFIISATALRSSSHLYVPLCESR